MKVLGKVLLGLVAVAVIGGIAVFAIRALSDKNETGIGTAGVVLDDVETMAFEVYFSRESPTGDCSLVEPVTRTAPESADIARAAVEALLEGPTPQEIQAGYITSINQGVELRDLEMSGRTLTATFSSRLNEGVAGSCRVTAIRSQIEQTLKQFATVSEAVIRIEGVPEGEELQP